MKIGILTYHRSENYGALLQAVALRSKLQEMGHDAYFIDYFPDYHVKLYKPFSSDVCSQYSIKGQMAYLLEYPLRKKRHQVFHDFIQKEIEPHCRCMDEEYDVVFYGSDQIWRKQDALGDFNPVYFGNNKIQAKVHASYAASMGVMNLSDEEKTKLKELVTHLKYVSVREIALKELIEELGFKNIRLDLDPTLLLTNSEWNHTIHSTLSFKKDFVLIYDLQLNCFDRDAIEGFAKKQNLDVIRLVGIAREYPTSYCRSLDGPSEFLSLIRGAKYVFTSSYHGLVFSLINNKQFFTSFKNNAGRAESILSYLGLSERMLPLQTTDIPEMGNIDYNLVSQRMAEARKESVSYIETVLESARL